MRAAIALVVLAGCGAYTIYKHTRLPARGHTDWAFATELTGAGTGTRDNAPMPELSVGARRRVAERADVGFTATLLPLGAAFTSASAEASSRVILGRHGRWSLAAGAGLGYRLTTSGGAVVETAYAAVPLIAGIDLGRHQLVLSPEVGYQRLWSTGAHPVGVPFAGYSVGFRWQLTRRWALLPEATVASSPARNFMSDHTRLFELGVAALFTPGSR